MIGINKNGYLKPLTITVKVYPLFKDKIKFIGFLQHDDEYRENMSPPNQELGRRDQHLIMTDGVGSITNVSEGIYHDFGLSAKFFFNNTSLHFKITIDMICPDLED